MIRFIGFKKNTGKARHLWNAYGVIEKLYMDNLNDVQIARLVGCDHSNIAQWRYKRKLPKNDLRGPTKEFFD